MGAYYEAYKAKQQAEEMKEKMGGLGGQDGE